jgi:hypothetical protein
VGHSEISLLDLISNPNIKRSRLSILRLQSNLPVQKLKNLYGMFLGSQLGVRLGALWYTRQFSCEMIT